MFFNKTIYIDAREMITQTVTTQTFVIDTYTNYSVGEVLLPSNLSKKFKTKAFKLRKQAK